MDYFVVSTTSGSSVQGKLPLMAGEALAWFARANIGHSEIRDAHGRTVDPQRLLEEARCGEELPHWEGGGRRG